MNRMKLTKKALLLLIIIGILAICSYQWFQDQKDVQNPSNCIKCHEMQPAYYTWQATTHNKLNCTVCHDISLTTLRYKHNHGYSQPIKMKQSISNSVCIQCHDQNKSITPPGDLIIPHQLHMQKGLDCIDCHSNIAHANSVAKLLAPQLVNYQDFGPIEAKLLIQNNNGVPMSKCLKCHNGTMAPKDCRACHKVESLPDFHQSSDWGYNHGTMAFNNLKSCYKCHGEDLALTSSIKINDNSKISLTNFARYNLFCQNCHKNRPLTHTTLFAIDHGLKAKTSRQGCYVCHDAKTTNKDIAKYGNIGQPATDTYCSKCHFTKHQENWLDIHKNQVTLYGETKCLSCHDEKTSCINCHQKSAKIIKKYLKEQ